MISKREGSMELKVTIVNGKRLRLKPGDHLIFEVEGPATDNTMDRIIHGLQPYFPDQKIIVLGSGIKFKRAFHRKEV
jgi:hypothetical protein